MQVYVANKNNDTISILTNPTINTTCQEAGFDTGDLRTYSLKVDTIEQITCVNFVGDCSGEITLEDPKVCTVENYVVLAQNLGT